MKPLIIIWTFYLCLQLPSMGIAKQTTLTNNDGKSISVILISKTHSDVLVKMENGKEHQIPYSRLSEESFNLVKNWEDPHLLLFKQLNSEYNFVFIEGKGDPDVIKEYISISKKYGYFTEFGDAGVPEGGLSIASLIFALNDHQYEKACARIIHERYTNFSGTGMHWGGQDGVKIKYIGHEMSRIAKEWPEGLPYYVIEDFRELQRAFLVLSQDIEKRRRSGSSNAYFISQDVRKYSKRIHGLLKSYGAPERLEELLSRKKAKELPKDNVRTFATRGKTDNERKRTMGISLDGEKATLDGEDETYYADHAITTPIPMLRDGNSDFMNPLNNHEVQYQANNNPTIGLPRIKTIPPGTYIGPGGHRSNVSRQVLVHENSDMVIPLRPLLGHEVQSPVNNHSTNILHNTSHPFIVPGISTWP